MDQLFAKITPQTLLLTVNRRLATHCQKQYATFKIKQKQSVWETPLILPINTWLQQYWETHVQKKKTLLNQSESLLIWENIINDSPVHHALLDENSTASLAAAAWQLMHQWQIVCPKPLYANTEYQAFYQWMQTYIDYCQQKQCVDNHMIAASVIDHIQTTSLKPFNKIIFIGFDELTPQLQRLIKTLQQQHYHCETYTPTIKSKNQYRLAFDYPDQELLAMANWAKQTTQAYPQQTIGCVIPDLNARWNDIVYTFNDVFNDRSQNTNIPGFSISSGEMLSDFPLIKTALIILQLDALALPLENIVALLHSPFLAGAEKEMISRGHLIQKLYEHRSFVFDKSTFMQIIESLNNDPSPYDCRLLYAYFQHFFSLQSPKQCSPKQWATHYNKLLVALGWPGERTLSSPEYQTVKRFQALLIEFSNLDIISPSIDAVQAIKHLMNLLQKTVFQPEDHETSIQILGTLETAGILFDQLWIAGLQDECWPAPVNPNPFLPIALQRQHHLPHSSAEREYYFCDLITKRLLQSASTVYVSYPMSGQDKQFHPSPLIQTIKEKQINEVMNPSFVSPIERQLNSLSIIHIEDSKAPPLHNDEPIRGGVHIFKHQAACPFRAYVQFRLHAKENQKPLLGFNALQKGNITHDILELLWGKIIDHQSLVAMNDAALTALIKQTIEAVFSKLSDKHALEIPKILLTLEKERYHALIKKWLTLEKERPPFSVIQREKKIKISFAGLALEGRIDRVDQLEDGSLLIMDYKTGLSNLIGLLQDRIDEPQLPIYCLHIPDAKGIAYAQVRTSSMKIIGLSSHETGIKGITEIEKKTNQHWQAQINDWRARLITTAKQFQRGEASVSPKDPPKTCQHCQLYGVCRI